MVKMCVCFGVGIRSKARGDEGEICTLVANFVAKDVFDCRCKCSLQGFVWLGRFGAVEGERENMRAHKLCLLGVWYG